MLIVPINYLTTLEYLKKLIDAGVDEFYMGYMPKEWYQKYGWEISSNKRYFPVIPHIINPENAKKLIYFLHNYNKRIYLALNELYYTQEQYRLLFKIIKLFESFKIDGYIVADLALILTMQERKVSGKIHLSSCAGCYNLSAISFYRQFDINRFILPQLLRPEEIINFLENTPQEVKFEVFVIGELCQYENAFCFTSHGFHRENFCNTPFKKYLIDRDGLEKKDFNNLSSGNLSQCKLCIISKFKKYRERIIYKTALRGSSMLGFEPLDLIKKIVKLSKSKDISLLQCQNLLGAVCQKISICPYKLNSHRKSKLRSNLAL